MPNFAKIKRSFQGYILYMYNKIGCDMQSLVTIYFIEAHKCLPFSEISGNIIHYAMMVTCDGKMVFKIFNASDHHCQGAYLKVNLYSPSINGTNSLNKLLVGNIVPILSNINGQCSLNKDNFYYKSECIRK
jgi:hypothetical protein